MNDRTRSALILLLGCVLGIALTLGGGFFAEREVKKSDRPWEDTRLMTEVLAHVKQEYVEPVNDSSLLESAVRGMVMDLDPHSRFLDQQEYEEIRINTTGNYSGVGLEVSAAGDEVTIVAPLDDTPAARAGLKTGDRIVSIDGLLVDKHNANEAIGRMRGKPGSQVDLTVEREGEPEPIEYKLVRSHVKVQSVRSEMLDEHYGYLRISHFSETTHRDLRKAIARLKGAADGALEGVVLDLRNNPGGVLEAAIEVSDLFLDSGLIVSANGRSEDATFRHEASDGDLLDGALLIVMVNEGSASASEIVAGALQDHQRATIVGAKTFGKGSVQTVMPISRGRALKLTTSRYFTPSGTSIQGSGIMPDIVLEDAAYANLMAGVDKHHTTPGDALLQTDKQLRQAMHILQGGRILQSRAE